MYLGQRVIIDNRNLLTTQYTVNEHLRVVYELENTFTWPRGSERGYE